MNSNNMKTNIFILMITALMALSSCMVTKTAVGEYKQQQGKEERYAKAKQLFFFGCRMGRTTVATPSDGNCMIKEKFSFGDALITTLTAGIISSRTIIVYTKIPKEKKE